MYIFVSTNQTNTMEKEKWYVRQGDDYVRIHTEISEQIIAEYDTSKSNHNLTVSNASIIARTHNKMIKQS